MFSNIFQKLKEMVQKMLGMQSSIEQTLHLTPAISSKMVDSIDLWTQMYEDKAPWLREPDVGNPIKVVSLGLPSFIASEKARMAVLELKSEITAPIESDNEDNTYKENLESKKAVNDARAKYLNDQYKNKLLSHIRPQLEYGIAKGGLIIKPYITKVKMSPVAGIDDAENVEDAYKMEFDFVQADCFYPFSFDSNGNLIEVAFIQTKTDKDMMFTRLEYHKLDGNKVTVINKAFETPANTYTNVSAANVTLGKEIPLTKIHEWKDLPPQATIHNVDRLLFGYFKMPDANIVDPHSPLGISGFARAIKLIKEADEQFSRLLWEYQAGEMAIDIDRDALTTLTDSDGRHTVPPVLQSRLFRTIDLGESDTYRVFAPQLRDNALVNGLNTLLMRIEDVCALSRGTISDAADVARTATELKILRQRSYSSNLEIQKQLENALRDCIYAMDVYCTLYNIVGDIPKKSDGTFDTSKLGKYEVSFTWDDSILVDAYTELQIRQTLLRDGILGKREIRMWYLGETSQQADEALDQIITENQKVAQRNMEFMQSMQQGTQQGEESNKDLVASVAKDLGVTVPYQPDVTRKEFENGKADEPQAQELQV